MLFRKEDKGDMEFQFLSSLESNSDKNKTSYSFQDKTKFNVGYVYLIAGITENGEVVNFEEFEIK